jgi:hypothetical protein
MINFHDFSWLTLGQNATIINKKKCVLILLNYLTHLLGVPKAISFVCMCQYVFASKYIF